MNTTLPDATVQLIKRVFALLETDHDTPAYYERAQGLLEACRVALDAIPVADTEGRESASPSRPIPVRRDLGPRIARLAFEGYGVRKIARIVGVAPSTVSRTLRRAR